MGESVGHGLGFSQPRITPFKLLVPSVLLFTDSLKDVSVEIPCHVPPACSGSSKGGDTALPMRHCRRRHPRHFKAHPPFFSGARGPSSVDPQRGGLLQTSKLAQDSS